MNKKSIAFACGTFGLVSIVGGVLCFFVPAMTNNLHSIAASLAGICLCIISIAWFIIARIVYKSAMREEQRNSGEHEILLSA